MSNIIDANGIQIEAYSDTLNALINGNSTVKGFKQIYGSDINTDQNTPDGQMLNIFALSKQDLLNLMVQIYDSFDPDQAVGVSLDSISQLCGIYRQAGIYTEVVVNVTVDRNVTLDGLDTSDTPFTVSDSTGNLFDLKATISLTSGTTALTFKAEEIGYIQVLANTITTIKTTKLGVTAVNNPSTPTIVGQDQETDAEMRVRRQASIALPAHGFLQSLRAGLLTIDGLTEAVIYENVTNTIDSDGVPAHTIWVIVSGGATADIAAMIYKYRNAGCGMKGTTSAVVTQIDGTSFTVYFDRAVDQDAYIYMHVESLSGAVVDNTAIENYLLSDYTLEIYQPVDVSEVIRLVKERNSDLVVTSCVVSGDGLTYSTSAYPSTKQSRFVLSAGKITVISTGGSSSSSSSSRSSSSSSRSSSSSSSSCRSSSSSSSCRSSSSSSSSCRSSSSSSSCRSSSSSSSAA